MTRSFQIRLMAVGLAAGVAACSDSTDPGARVSDTQLNADVAADAGDATVLDLAQMLGSEVQAGAEPPWPLRSATPRPGPRAPTRRASAASFARP